MVATKETPIEVVQKKMKKKSKYVITKKPNKTQREATRERKRKKIIIGDTEAKEQNSNIRSFPDTNYFRYKWFKLCRQKTQNR